MAQPETAIDPAPVRLAMQSYPPLLEIGPPGAAVDLRPSFQGMDMNVAPDGRTMVGLYLEVDPQVVDWLVDVIEPKGGAHPADSMTAEHWNEVLMAGSAYGSPGEKIAAHLRTITGRA